MNEEVSPAVYDQGGHISIKDPRTLASLNHLLSHLNMDGCLTPYIAIEKARKVLAYFHLHFPKVFLEGKSGYKFFGLNQFGEKFGMNDQGEVVTSIPTEFFLWIDYSFDNGYFFCNLKVLTKEKLDKAVETWHEFNGASINESKVKVRPREVDDNSYGYLARTVKQRIKQGLRNDVKELQRVGPKIGAAAERGLVNLGRAGENVVKKGLAKLKLNESITADTSKEEIIADFLHSKAKTFSNDTKKERIKRALGAYYSHKK